MVTMREALVLGALLLAVTGCSGTAPPDRSAVPAPSATSSSTASATPGPALDHVALGDSYSSGAGTPGAPATGCRRSPRDYGALAAAELGATYVDATCSGARTEHLSVPQPHEGGPSAPPQLDALSATTDVVTVGLGFNDHGFLRNLTRPGRDKSVSVTRVAAIGRGLEAALGLVAARAPEARVVLVGYPQLVPETGSCPELPWTPEEYAEGRAAFAALAEELAEVASRADVAYVDVAAASAGHDVCAGDQAWVNGARPRPGVAAPYHPLEQEQEAVAALVLQALS